MPEKVLNTMDEKKTGRFFDTPWKTAGIVLSAFAVFLVLLWVFVFRINRFDLTLELKGEEEVTVAYGHEFADAGVVPVFRGTLLISESVVPDVTVSASGQVDTDRIGVYEIRYSASYHQWKAEAVRTVHVVDRISPVISLTDDPQHLTVYGDPYEEDGYTAYDEYDGDLTAAVQREEKDGTVIYTVSDASGNQTKVVRTIRYHDPRPPQILLTGGEDYTVMAGKRFEDPGFSAVDNHDGDVTCNVTVEGEVDGYFPGNYVLEYSVTDSFGNTATVSRKVTVTAHERVQTQVPSGRIIYLTFDDGPGAYTDHLLDILAKYDVKATFFVIDTGNYSTLKRIVEEGHSIGIHSVTHDYRQIYAGMDAFFDDLYAMQEIIYQQTGVTTTLMRFPGGSSNTVSRFNKGIMSRLTMAVECAGFQYFDWNVDSDDAGKANTAKKVYDNVVKGVSGRRVSVVLHHDIKEATIDAIERIIVWGLNNGYTFLPLEPSSPTAHHGVNN